MSESTPTGRQMRRGQVSHTKGPWTATVGLTGARINVANDYNHPLSFGFRYDGATDAGLFAEAEANARLIAAAPDLLAACKAVLHWYEVDSSEYNREMAIHDVRNAIAKATRELPK